MTLHVELVSPERLLYEGEAKTVIARTVDGEIGFQSQHIPFVGVLLPAAVRVQQEDGTEQVMAVHRGFIEVANNQLTVLTDVAELAQEIDVDRARAAQARAQAAVEANDEDLDAKEALERALARLKAAGAEG